jgi:hypothetical protein
MGARTSVEPASASARLQQLFGCDLRSLAALRIALGLCVLVDVAVRSLDLVSLYTEQGVLPRRLLTAMDGPGVHLSAHVWAGASPWLQAALFAVTGAAAVALAVGWRTRLVTLACWYLVASVQIRQPLVYMGGDSMLRLLLFWGLFLPLGARFSVDAARGRQRHGPNLLLSAATVAILLQVCLMYWATGLRKTGPLWWSGQAIYYALHSDLATPLGTWLTHYPAALTPLTYGTLALELLGPLVAFVPVATAWFRMLAVVMFWSFHLGLASAMNIGLFPVFSMAGWLAFLPGRFWSMVGVDADPAAEREPGPTLPSRLLSATAVICLAYIVVLLAERARIIPRVLPEAALQVGRALRIQQSWGMFAPDPSRVALRLAINRSLVDGRVIEGPAGDTFRSRLYVWTAGSELRPGGPAARSLVRRAMAECDESTAIEQVAIVKHEYPVAPAGSPHTVSVLVDIPCPQ